MRVFKEEQAFRQSWLIFLLGFCLLITAIPIFNLDGSMNWSAENFLGFILMLLIIILFWTLKLETKIDAHGIITVFKPFSNFKRSYKWNEIRDCYVRKYAPISEYGGWGIRGFGKATAYNVSGNMGIQIVSRKGEKFLIGTNKASEAQQVIKHFKEKREENEKFI